MACCPNVVVKVLMAESLYLYLNFQYKLADSPEPSDAEEESSDEEEDGFGPKKAVNDDPVARKK